MVAAALEGSVSNMVSGWKFPPARRFCYNWSMHAYHRKNAGAALAIALLLGLLAPRALHGQGLIEPPANAESFVSLRSETVNMRVGPGRAYPIIWTYKRKGWPVVIIDRYENWRQVLDPEGIEGWIHSSLLSGARTVLIHPAEASVVNLHAEASPSAPVRARLEGGVIARLESCDQGWCRVKVGDYNGWVRRSALWGAD